MSENLPDEVLLIEDYIQEIYVLSEAVVSLIEEIEGIVSDKRLGMKGVFNFPDNDKFFYIEPRIFTRISAALVHSANLNKILFATPRKSRESKYKYDYRIIREKHLEKYFTTNDLTEIRKSETRNSLEHYDERLDNVSLRLWNGSMSEVYHVVANNIVLSSEGALVGNPFYLKCYVMDTKVYKNHESESNLKKLYTEARLLNSQAKDALNGSDPYSGTVIPIPPRNNS